MNPSAIRLSLRMLCIAGIFFTTRSFAQSAEPFQKSLRVALHYRGYLSNYEYFNPVVPGFTLFGNILEPLLTFKSDSTWTLRAGAWLQQDFGFSGFRRAEPNLQLEYSKRNIKLRFGNIDVYDQHNLPGWLYDGDDFVTRGPAYGEQININGYRLTADQWVAWRRMIYPESIDQERIEAGLNLKLNLNDSASRQRAYVPAHGILLHNGGQIGHIDTLQRVLTLYAVAAGFGVSQRFENSFVSMIGAESVFGYCNNDDLESLPPGKAVATRAFASFRHGIGLETGWWVGDNFYVPTGTPLFQSRSSVYAHDTAYFNQRQILFATLTWHYKPINGLTVDAWIQPYYDVNLKLTEYSYRLRLTYRFNATLKTFN